MAEVTECLTSPPIFIPRTAGVNPNMPALQSEMDPVIASQSPSMQRIMQQNPDLIPRVAPPVTPAAAQALAARQALIMSAGKEKPEDGRTSKRKM
jgi:hypothetical protein